MKDHARLVDERLFAPYSSKQCNDAQHLQSFAANQCDGSRLASFALARTASNSTMSIKPKRTLIAYCALAESLSKPNVRATHALIPFLAEACSELGGKMFDAGEFARTVKKHYEIVIPKLAVLGLAEEMCQAGYLSVSGHGNSLVYHYTSQPPRAEGTQALTEQEIESVLQRFVAFARTDARLTGISDEDLHREFLERLLNVDSMRILHRKEGSTTVKKSSATLQVKAIVVSEAETNELHLDYLVAQFLLNLRESDAPNFERVSSVAFANMVAEAVACFREPPEHAKALTGLKLFFDTPLLLDMLGVNTEYEEYGTELLRAIIASGARASLFEHSVGEAENTIKGRLASLHSGFSQANMANASLTTTGHLSSLSGRVAERAQDRLGIKVDKSPDAVLHRRSPETVGNIEDIFVNRMRAWSRPDAKDFDRQSVWALLALGQSNEPCFRICDAPAILLTRNTPLVHIANDAWRAWIKGVSKQTEPDIARAAPVAMSDKQFAGYLWARTGGGSTANISSARLLAHCSAAVRPRADLKSKAYNLVLDLHGTDKAADFAALLEQREGANALMKASHGDPEDITRERLPFIMDRVIREAGEYAAAREREESDRARQMLVAQHESERAHTLREFETERFRAEAEKVAANQKLLQIDFAKAAAEADVEKLRADIARAQTMSDESAAAVRQRAIAHGEKVYTSLRWVSAVIIFAATWLLGSVPDASSFKPYAPFLGALLALMGWWFVPSIFEGPCNKIASTFARKRFKSLVPGATEKLDVPKYPRAKA